MPETGQPTLKDVARSAGVHVGTASRALSADQSHLVSADTRARVQSAADVLGYRTNAVAQSLRTGRTGAIGVIVADLANPFIVALLRGIEAESGNRDVVPLVAETHDDPAILRSVLTRLLRNRVDAIILSAAHTTDEDLVSEIEAQVPVILAVRGVGDNIDASSEVQHLEVLQDDVLGARIAVTHLIDLGHRRIAQMPGDQRISSFKRRSAGYRSAIGAHPHVSDVSTGGHAIESTIAEGRRLAVELLRRPVDARPTAIFAHNDQMAVGAIDAIRDEGLRCPEDVSVVGYNDAPLSDHVNPPLTTVRLPTFELGRHSARLMFDALARGTVEPQRILLAPEFIERKSTMAVGS